MFGGASFGSASFGSLVGPNDIVVAGIALDASYSIALGTVTNALVLAAPSSVGNMFQLAPGVSSGALSLAGVEFNGGYTVPLGSSSGGLTISGVELSALYAISLGSNNIDLTLNGNALDSGYTIVLGSYNIPGVELFSPYSIPLGSILAGGATVTGNSLNASYDIIIGRAVWVEDTLFTPAPTRRVRPVVELEDYQLVYPFELPLFSQRTIERDRTLSAWNNDLQKWWANVRKNLKATVGSASAVEALEKQVAELQALLQQTTSVPPAIVTKHFGGSTSKWEYKHQRGVRPLVTAWVMHPTYGYTTLEGHQYEDIALNTTTLEWDANYNGHAVYAFPSLTV